MINDRDKMIQIVAHFREKAALFQKNENVIFVKCKNLDEAYITLKWAT